MPKYDFKHISVQQQVPYTAKQLRLKIFTDIAFCRPNVKVFPKSYINSLNWYHGMLKSTSEH